MHKEDGNFSKLNEKFFRIIPTRRPSVNIYENVVDEEELEALYYLEARTNPRMREESGETSFITDEEKYCGQNSSLINAPFLNYSPLKQSRFSNGSFGVFYCAKEIECAIEETKYHTLKFLQATDEKTYKSQRRVLTGDFDGELCDIRNKNLVDIYSPHDYSQSQIFGASLKKESKDGIAYDSVRCKGGTCYAIFKPSVIKKIKELKCFNYVLDNDKIIVEKI